MFNIGDEVFIKNSEGLRGIVFNKINGIKHNDYLVKTEIFEKWYHEHELKLASTISKTETITDYSIKSDKDKPQLSLVPIKELWTAIARVREHGIEEYGDNDSWKKVELKRYHNALLRHCSEIDTDLNAIDKKSGLPHRWHIACNLAFIEALMEEM